MIQSNAQLLQIGHHCLPMRNVMTCDGTYEVPRYVYRNSNDAAWRIDIKRQCEPDYYRYLSDHDYGSTQQALTSAIERLYEVLPNYKRFDQLNPGSSHWYAIREVPSKTTGLISEFVQTYICGYHGKLRLACFWVGTENTRSDKRLRLAIDRAIGTRCWSIEMIRSEGRDVLFQAPVPRHVERFAV